MITIDSECFNNIAKYLDTPLGKISKKNELYTRTNKNQTITGVINIIFSLLKESNNEELKDLEDLEEVLIYQWLDYALVYAVNINNAQNLHSILKNLNEILAEKTFIIGHKLSIADVFLYYILIPKMVNLSNIEKEKYINLSRWFDNIQQNPEIRQNNRFIDFSTIYLSNLVPSSH